MKIVYSVPQMQLKEHYDAIRLELSRIQPDAHVEVDIPRALLVIDLPAQADPTALHGQLRQFFQGLGITASAVPADQCQFYSSAGNARPPIEFTPASLPGAKKTPRTVRLSVFLISLISTVLVVALLAFGVGAIVGSIAISDQTLGTGEQEGESFVGKISLIDQFFEDYALYDTDGKLLLDEMLKAYVAATGDQYAAYYNEQEAAVLFREMGGGAVGIGITVTKDPDTGNILLIQVYPDSPAERAGFQAGDLIVKIGTKAEGKSVSELGYDMALDQMAGESGSVLSVVVLRDGEELELSATRTPITIQSVLGSVSESDPKVGIVRITSFQAKTPAQFKEVMDRLIAAGCERFVFDLRNNLGGEQRSILAILSYFAVEDDVLLVTVEKNGNTTYEYAVPQTYVGDYADCSVKREEIGMYRAYPNVVLTNGYTASAAELFTGTLRDFGLTTQVGETTYGKGVKQSIIDLEPYGYTGILRLTTGYYAPPLGVNYDGVGLVPHQTVLPSEEMLGKNPLILTEAEDNQLTAAIAVLQEK